MKWTRMLFAGVLLAAASCAAIATATTQPRAHQAATMTVNLGTTGLGQILVSSTGHTLYEFTSDPKRMDHCITISGCPTVWPPLLVTSTPTAGAGVKAKALSTITLPEGAKQVTYHHHPLYMYSADSGPGETSYVGAFEFGGYWYAMNAKGKAVK